MTETKPKKDNRRMVALNMATYLKLVNYKDALEKEIGIPISMAQAISHLVNKEMK